MHVSLMIAMRRWAPWLALPVLSGVLAGCASSRAPGQNPAVAGSPPGAVVTEAISRTVPIYSEAVAQMVAVQTVSLRAQVAGTLEQVLFKQGSEVRQGQLLFVIDQRPFIAALQSSRAQVATPRANLKQALQQVQLRQAQLAALKAIHVNTQPQARRDQYLVAQQALASERAAQAAIDLAASGLRPNITVSAGPQLLTSDPTNKDVVNFAGTIALTLAILDGGLTQAKIEAARAQLQAAQVTEAEVRQQVELDVRNAYLALGNAADSLRSALAGQTAAREALRIANVRFQAGVGTQLEVVTQIQNLATADTQVIQAGLNYFVAVAQLDRALGVQVKI